MKNFSNLSRLCKVLALTALFCTVSCAQNSDDSSSSGIIPKSKAGVLAVFYQPGSRGDLSYTDMLSAGVNKAALKHNLLLAQYEPKDLDSISPLFNQSLLLCDRMIKDKKKALIIFASPDFKSFISANSSKISEYAEKGVIFLSDESKENAASYIHTFYMPFYGVNYEAGIAASSLLSADQKALLLLEDAENASLKEYSKAFLSGFCASKTHGKESDALWGTLLKDILEDNQSKDKIKNVLIVPVQERRNEENLTDILYMFAKLEEDKELDVHLILPYCGKAVHGLLLYNRENPDSYYTIGTDVDMQFYSDRVPFSIVKHIDKVIEKCVDQALEGTLPKHQNFGLKDGYTELVLSSRYEPGLAEIVEKAHQTAIEKEEAYENN